MRDAGAVGVTRQARPPLPWRVQLMSSMDKQASLSTCRKYQVLPEDPIQREGFLKGISLG